MYKIIYRKRRNIFQWHIQRMEKLTLIPIKDIQIHRQNHFHILSNSTFVYSTLWEQKPTISHHWTNHWDEKMSKQI